MPKAVRKSLSRCSSRSSSRSSCRKRNSPRDNVLNTIREAVRSSSTAHRYSTFKRESPLAKTPVAAVPKINPKPQSETKIKKSKPEAIMPKGAKLPEANIAAEKPTSLIEHGIRYIMLPLHLFHLCVWGSPTPTSAKTKEVQTSSAKLQENEKKSSISSSSKNQSRKNLTPSPTSSTSGFSSCSSNPSKTSRVASIIKPSISSSTSSDVAKIVASSSSTSSSAFLSSSSTSKKPLERLSPKTRKTPIPRRIFREETTDDSSDEMVTADEYFDDSSNDRWSSAASSPSMNMSIDFEGYNNGLEKISSHFPEDYSAEEPMDVSMEESNFNVKPISNRSPSRNFRPNSLKGIAEKRSDNTSSSSGSEDLRSSCREDFSSSSADREIAAIFQRASTSPSSSSDDEYYNHSSGRRNNPFVKGPTGIEILRSRPHEELYDAAIRKKRTTPCAYDDPPRQGHEKRINRVTPEVPKSAERPSNSQKIKESSEKNTAKQSNQDVAKVSSQTDSAYSDEDVEMNFINESMNNHLQSFAMQSLQESVIEWMDQDLDYVADTEDSNDGSPLPGRSRISSTGLNSRSGFSEDKVEKKKNVEGLKKTCAGDRSLINVEITSPEDQKNMEGLKKNLGVIASPEIETTLDKWRKKFGLEGSDYNGQIAGRGPPGFPERPQHPSATKCHCGDPRCFFLPLALPVDESSSVSWIKNYPRAPSPLKHLYYEYPEFMNPPTESLGNKKSPYVLIPANFVLP